MSKNQSRSKPFQNLNYFWEKQFPKLPFSDRFGNWLGYEVRVFDRKNKRVLSELKIQERHLSPSNHVHGGTVSAFCDFAAGAAVFTTLKKGEMCSTVELKVHFLKPLRLGDKLLLETQVVFRGNRLCVIEGHLYRNHGKKAAALVTATFYISKISKLEAFKREKTKKKNENKRKVKNKK